MNEEDVLFATFLTQPHGPTKYLVWLEERGARAEYLRILIGLNEPTTPDPSELTRERLRKLRPHIDDAWTDRVDRALLITNGFYQSDPVPDGRLYLHFCSDGTVLSVCSKNPVPDVWRLLNSTNDPSPIQRGRYKIQADRLELSLPYQPSDVLLGQWQSFLESKVQEEVSRAFADCGAHYPGIENDIEGCRIGAASALTASMRCMEYSGTIGKQVMCLRWHNAFAASLAGVTTYRFVSAPPDLAPVKAPELAAVKAPAPDRTEEIEIRYGLEQNLSPPCYRRASVSVSRRGSVSATITASAACRLALVIERTNPVLAVRLRAIADEVIENTGGEHVEQVSEDPEETALAARILGVDPSRV